jgi:hypothetical protein
MQENDKVPKVVTEEDVNSVEEAMAAHNKRKFKPRAMIPSTMLQADALQGRRARGKRANIESVKLKIAICKPVSARMMTGIKQMTKLRTTKMDP